LQGALKIGSRKPYIAGGIARVALLVFALWLSLRRRSLLSELRPNGLVAHARDSEIGSSSVKLERRN
jgi:hypothetical protein